MTPFRDFNNAQVARLPNHLKQFIVEQHYKRYTPIDHAVWRYVMRQNYSYLKDVAYYPYIPGLHKAGLTIEKIPDLQEMNDALGEIGWGAVTVDGFIPPAAFMEYQAYKVLVIAADIRQLHHIEYTPAPDIIHESAGHAPIIADPDYNEYLSYFGSIGAKAMFSSKDFELYEAIRALSILKESPDSTTAQLEAANKKVQHCQQNLGEPSEMALLSRLHWWTVEYGLIGTLEHPKIYGAGLLSSMGESCTCMQPEVQKLWYTIDAINFPFDITQPQPQLFVTPTFQNLVNVLEEFANTMSFRIGGLSGIQKAIECKNTCTAVYSSGLQVSGVFTQALHNQGLSYIKLTGPTALAVNDKQLNGHGKDYHKDGFSSPVGFLKGFAKPLEDFDEAELQQANLVVGNTTTIEFESGILVSGFVENIVAENNKIVLISFTGCTVSNGKSVLFKPEWGTFDMAVGNIISVYSGAADKDAFHHVVPMPLSLVKPHVFTTEELAYQQLFKRVRYCREQQKDLQELQQVWHTIKAHYTNDWLCSLEIMEILVQHHIYENVQSEIKRYLQQQAHDNPAYTKLIKDGFHLLSHPVEQYAF